MQQKSVHLSLLRFTSSFRSPPYRILVLQKYLCHSSETIRCHTFLLFRNSCLILAVCFGSLSYWNIPLMAPSINVISPTPFALMQPHTFTLPPPCFTVGTIYSLWQSWPGSRQICWTPTEPNKFQTSLMFLFLFNKFSCSFVPKSKQGFFWTPSIEVDNWKSQMYSILYQCHMFSNLCVSNRSSIHF